VRLAWGETVFAVGLAIVTMFVILSGYRMIRGESYRFVQFGGILALLPLSPAWLISLPTGIWSLVVLSRRDVRAIFETPRRADSEVGLSGHARKPQNYGDPPPNPAVASQTPAQPRHATQESAADLKAVQGVIGTQAKALVIAGAIGFLLPLIVIVGIAVSGQIRGNPPLGVVLMLFTLPIALVINLGGEKMFRLHSYAWAMTSSILAMLPIHLGWFIGLPAGAVALVALRRPDVRLAFQNYRPAPAECDLCTAASWCSPSA